MPSQPGSGTLYGALPRFAAHFYGKLAACVPLEEDVRTALPTFMRFFQVTFMRPELVSALVCVGLCLPALARPLPGEHTLDGAVEVAWESVHAAERSTFDRARALVLRDGDAFVTGSTRQMNSSGARWWTSSYDLATGTERWRTLFPSAYAHGQEAVDLALSGDGARLFVTGKTYSGSGVGGVLTMGAWSSVDGQVVWTEDWSAAPVQAPEALVATKSPTAVFAVGVQSNDMLVLARSQQNGTLLWSATFDGGKTDVAFDAALAPDESRLFVVGRSDVGSQGGGAVLAFDTSTGALLWSVAHAGSTYIGELRSIAVAADGATVFVAGDLGSNDDVLALDAATGATLWSAPFDSAAPWLGGARELGLSPDGSKLLVTGTGTAVAGDGELRTVALDAQTGAVLWTHDWDAPAVGADEERGLGLTVDVRHAAVVVVGSTQSLGGETDWASVALDLQTGLELWARVDAGPGADLPFDVASLKGRVVIAGEVDAGIEEANFAVRAVHGATGGDLWDVDEDLVVPAADTLWDLGLSPDGSTLFATGEACCSQGAELFALDAVTGLALWSRSLLVGEPSRGLSLVADPLGGFVHAAGQLGDGNYLARHDALTGNQLWMQPIPGLPWAGWAPVRVAADPSGARIYTTAAVGGEASTTHDYVTSAWDPLTGASLWTQVHDPKAEVDEPAALAVSPDGPRVFVTGLSAPTTYTDTFGFTWPDVDMGTVAYDAAGGAPLWASYYHGAPGVPQDTGRALGVSPDATRVFVTGTTMELGTTDFMTVAYDAILGTELWTARFAGAGGAWDEPTCLAVDPSGSRVFVSGSSGPLGSQADQFATVAYDATSGVELWRDLRATPTDDEAWDIAVDPTGSRVIVTGWRRDPNLPSVGAVFQTLVFDASTGELLGEADFAEPGPPARNLLARALALAPDGRHFFVAGESALAGTSDQDVALLAYAVPTLATDVVELSASTGGTQTLSLLGDATQAGRPYLVLGSLGPTWPGLWVDQVLLPLTVDTYFFVTLQFTNQAPFAGTFGQLGATGRSTATITLPPGLAAPLIGLTLQHAYLVFELPGAGFATLASNAQPLTITP